MSRSNPTEGAPNPATRWYEWNGEKGHVRYYDKDAKQTVDVPLPFTFLLLDQLGSVRGWDDSSQSGIYSNLVKDTRKDVLVVKSFKGGTLATGIYKDIKDRVNVQGGRFNANCYIAYKHGDGLKIGVLQFKGAALGAWMEFAKQHRSDLYAKAVTIHDVAEGKKGRVVFFTPVMKTAPVTVETQAAAESLDKTLQAWLTAYLARNTQEQTERQGEHVRDEDFPDPDSHEPLGGWQGAAITDEDIPF